MADTAGNGARVRARADAAVNERVGARLRDLRDLRGVTQKDMAARMAAAGHDWYQTTVTRIESGKRSLLAREAFDLARIFDVTVNWFAEGNGARA